MDNFMQNLAANLISSLKYLDLGISKTNAQEREKSLQNIINVMELKMDLSNKILQGIFLSCLSYLSDKKIHEPEIILILRLFELFFENYSTKNYFIPQSPENIKFFALLVKCLNENLKSEAKEIALKASRISILLSKFLNKENLMQFYPSMCSENIKILLDIGPRMYSKLLVSCVEFMKLSFEKLLDNSSYQKKAQNISDTLLNFTEKMINSDKKYTSSIEADKNENQFYTEGRKNLFSFFAMLKVNEHKYPDKDNLNTTFINLFEVIFEKCSNFFMVNQKGQFELVFDLYLHFLSRTDQPISPVKILSLYPNMKNEFKQKQLKVIKELPKLMNEVDTNLYLATFRKINIGYTILKESKNVLYSQEEIEAVAQAFTKAFQITFRGKILLNEEAYNEFEPQKLIKKELTPDYVSDSFHQFNKSWNRFFMAYLPITNFEESVFDEIIVMFSLLDEYLSHSLSEYYYNLLTENKFRRSEELLTTLSLFLLVTKNSVHKLKDMQKVMDYFLTNPYHNVDPSNILRVKEHKLLIDLFSIQITFQSFQMISEKSPILVSKILIYLFSKFYQDNTLMSLLIWNCLIVVTRLNYKDMKTLEEFMTFYSETLIRNFIDKLKIINFLPDPEMPFKLLSSFVCFSDPVAVLKYSETLLTHLNSHYDKFYLREDTKSIQYVFPIYKLIFECADKCFKDNLEKAIEIVKTSNMFRRVLMRIKPSILERDKHVSFYSLQIFNTSCRILSKLPMDVEDSSVNFSTEDSANVTIPESLGPIAYEFFDVISFKIKKNEHPAMVLECLRCLKNIQNFNPNFLIHERRFELNVMPSIISILQKESKDSFNSLDLKILEVMIDIVKEIDLENYGEGRAQFKQNLTSLNQIISTALKSEENEQLVSLCRKFEELKTKFQFEEENQV